MIMGTGQGLMTPVLKDVGGKGLKSISKEIGEFEVRVRGRIRGRVWVRVRVTVTITFIPSRDLSLFP
jgi:hypothetical protein